MSGSELLSKQRRYNIGEYKNLITLTANTVTLDFLKFGIHNSNVTITYPEDLTNNGYTLVLPNRSGVSGEFLGIDDNNKLKWGNPNVINNVRFKYGHGLNSSFISAPYTRSSLITPDNYEITIKPTSTTSKLLIQFRVAYQASFSADTAITFELWKRIGNNPSSDTMIQSEANLGPINGTGTNKSQYVTSSIIESGTTEEITIYLGFKFNNLTLAVGDILPAGINVGILGDDNGYKNSLMVTDFEGSGGYSTLLSKSHDNESIYYNLGTLFLGSNFNSLNTNNTSSLSLKTQDGISAPLFIGHLQGNVTGNYVITDNITCLNLTSNIIDTNMLNSNIITTDKLEANIFTTNTLTSNIITSNMIHTYDISINNSLKTKDLDVYGNLHVHGTQRIINSEVLNIDDNIIVINADGNIEKQAGLQANIDGNLYNFFFDICLNGWSIYNKNLHLNKLLGNNISLTENITAQWLNGNINSNFVNVSGNININDNYILDLSAIKFSDGSFFNSNILNENIESINSNISTLQTEMNAVEGNIIILQGNISTLETEMNAVEGNITILQGNVSTLQTEMNAVEGIITILQGNVSNLHNEMNTVEGNITLLQGNVSTLHNEMNTVEGNITLLQGNVSTLLSNIDQSVKTTSNVTFNKLTISDTVTINGNLTVRGNKTIVDSVEHVITDTLITLNSKGLSDPIGIEGNTTNGNIIQFVFDQTNNYWHTGGKSLKANIIGDISGRNAILTENVIASTFLGNILGSYARLDNLRMFGDVELNNNYILDVSAIRFKNGNYINGNSIPYIYGHLDYIYDNLTLIGNSLSSRGNSISDLQSNVAILQGNIINLQNQIEESYTSNSNVIFNDISANGNLNVNGITNLNNVVIYNNIDYFSDHINLNENFTLDPGPWGQIGGNINIQGNNLNVYKYLNVSNDALFKKDLTVNGNIVANKFIGELSGTNATLTDNVTAPIFNGNLSGVYATLTDNVTAPIFNGNLSGTNVTLTENVRASWFNGNLSGTNITLTENVRASWFNGNLSGTDASLSNNVNASWFNGNLSGTNVILTENVIASWFNGNLSGTNIILTENVIASWFNGNLSGTNAILTENVNASWFNGNLSGTDASLSNNVNALWFNGNLSGTDAILTENVTASWFNGNLSGTDAILTENVRASWFNGNLSGIIANLNKLNMTGNINLNNNYWINDVSGILFADGTILTSNQISSIGGTGSNVDLNTYADVSFGNMDISSNINFINGNTGIYYNNDNYIEKRNSKLELVLNNVWPYPSIQSSNDIPEYLKIYGSNLFLNSSTGLIIIGNDSSRNSDNCIQMNSRSRFNGYVDFRSPVYFNTNAELNGTMNINNQGLSINGGTGSYFKDCILRLLATSRQNLYNSRLGIHIPGQVEAGLDVNTESIFRDTITAKNKINLIGNLSIAKSITHNWDNYGQDLSGDLSNDQFGSSVAINNIGNIIAVGAPFSDINGTNSGLVRIYENINSVWNQIGQDLSGAVGEQFGYSLSINDIGNIIAVGAPFSNINGIQSGAVRIYENINNSWEQIDNDLSGVAGDNFGHSLSINSLGDKIIVGAPHNNINGTDSGVVRIYQNITNSWNQVGVDIFGISGEQFGYSVSNDGTGDIIAIGAPFYSSGNYGYYQNDGRVIIYNLNGSIWQQKGQINTGETSGDKSGYSVSLSKDGSRVAIGAIENDGNGNESGHVRVYYHDGNWWQKLGNDIDGVVYNANSGWAVSLNNNGSRVIIGQPSIDMGIVKIYDYESTVNVDWIEFGQTIYGKNISDKFGYSVGINGDGTKIIVGSPQFDSNGMNNNGEVYVYELKTNYNNSNIDVSGGATFSSDVNILGNLTVNGTFTNSDKRLKENNIDIINGIELIKKLKPQIYDKRNKLEVDNNNYYIKESGFIAQDIEEVEELKHLINKPKNIEKEPYTMNYIGLIAYNIAATKELDNIVEQLKIKINSQENRIQELENKVLLQEILINYTNQHLK
jgi:hypothetical protein